MLCARACGTESNCNTANYNTEDNKCDLFKERVEKNSHGAAMITSRGCYLITKVEIARSSQEIKDPAVPNPGVKWLHFTPQWCTGAGRGVKFGGGKTAEECKEMCKEGCLGVEWWETYTLSCYNCTDPSKRAPYTYTNDQSYPPHVFLKSNS
ncbi:hypothetical protein OS493_020118 [Desmophyllum pertusum]|uniref:Apple domain-containing protein n=1 Tax=Desmophyllum pertusum TaxID=174260 RepID=A0A9X0DAM7_9CNID|nr:hypothetical protein OS493_020118 [Desmophyllum pertusum]